MNDEEKIWPLMDTYYHIKLVPKMCEIKYYDNNIDVYIKGENLALFISDMFPLYNIKIVKANHEGYVITAGYAKD